MTHIILWRLEASVVPVAVLRCWEQCEERKATRSWQEISWLRMALFSWDKKQALIRVGNSRAESLHRGQGA